jgi:ribonuclease G
MQQDILINWSPQETRVAVIESGAVQELHVERTLERGLVGNVYLGKVARVLPGMQSAFIDIGLERAAFLHVADVWHRQAEGDPPACTRARRRCPDPIEKPGVRRPVADGAGHQGPDRQQGRTPVHPDQHRRALLVFLPQDDHIGVSQKIGARACATSCAAHAGLGRPTARGWRASSCAPTAKTPAMPSWPRTSPTCARPGQRIREASQRLPPGTCCTRT